MAQTSVSIRMDENLKKQFDYLCEEFGMNTTTAFTIFAKAVVRERRIPFDIEASDPFYSTSNMEHLKKSISSLEKRTGTSHELIEVNDNE